MSFLCKRNINKYLSIFFVLLGAIFLFASYKLPKYSLVPVDADAIPTFLGGTLIVLAILLFFVKDEVSEQEEDKESMKKEQSYWQVVIFIIAILLYITLLEVIGFFVVTALFIMSMTYLLGYRRHLINVIVSITVPSCFWMIFTFLLKIPLPAGIISF